MSQNLVTLNLTDAQLTAVDASLADQEKQLGALIALSQPQKKSLRRMGQKSEAFCRQTLRVLEQNPQIVPANVPLADAIADLVALEQLRPRIVRLSTPRQLSPSPQRSASARVTANRLKAVGPP